MDCISIKINKFEKTYAMKSIKLAVSVISIILLIGLSLSAFINIDTTNLRDQYEVKEINDIQYYPEGKSDQTKLNLIIPQGVKNPPVFIWIGQGAWAYVNRHVEMNICRAFSKKGILVVSAGHSLSPALLGEKKIEEGVRHPQHVKDIAMAFKWVYEHASEYNYDVNNIFVGGYSSGAHLATLLAMDNRYLSNLGLSNQMIKAIIPVGGGYDIPHYKKDLLEEDEDYDKNHIIPVFGSSHEAHIDASPTTYIDSLITPILMISESDTYKYSIVFERLLAEKKAKNVEVLNIHSESHSSLWKKLGNAEQCLYRDYIVDYIKSKSE